MYRSAIAARAPGNFVRMSTSKHPDKKQRLHAGQINFKDAGALAFLTVRDGYDTQRVIAGIAFELDDAVKDVKEVLESLGIFQLLDP
jgi:hypothetical protein